MLVAFYFAESALLRRERDSKGTHAVRNRTSLGYGLPDDSK